MLTSRIDIVFLLLFDVYILYTSIIEIKVVPITHVQTKVYETYNPKMVVTEVTVFL